MFGIDTQDLQDLKIVDVKVGTGAEAKPGELVRQLPAFFYSLPRGSLKTATVA